MLLVRPDVSSGFPAWFTVIVTSSISSTVAAVLLNIVFNRLRWPAAAEKQVSARREGRPAAGC